jgi:peptidoglycan hydrolase CwlO-like protein
MKRDDPTTLPNRMEHILKEISNSDKEIELLNKEIEELQAQLIKI